VFCRYQWSGAISWCDGIAVKCQDIGMYCWAVYRFQCKTMSAGWTAAAASDHVTNWMSATVLSTWIIHISIFSHCRQYHVDIVVAVILMSVHDHATALYSHIIAGLTYGLCKVVWSCRSLDKQIWCMLCRYVSTRLLKIWSICTTCQDCYWSVKLTWYSVWSDYSMQACILCALYSCKIGVALLY